MFALAHDAEMNYANVLGLKEINSLSFLKNMLNVFGVKFTS